MLMTCSLCVAQPSKEKAQVQKTINDIFDTFGTRDIKTFRDLVTNDIKIYEDGVILTLDSMVSYFSKAPSCRFFPKERDQFSHNRNRGKYGMGGIR